MRMAGRLHQARTLFMMPDDNNAREWRCRRRLQAFNIMYYYYYYGHFGSHFSLVAAAAAAAPAMH